MSAALTWAQIIEHCSRLHTTRRRRALPEHIFPEQTEMREDSQTLDILVRGVSATIVPTRMHEPGFYVRARGNSAWTWRSDDDLAEFRRLVDAGRVHGEAANGDPA